MKRALSLFLAVLMIVGCMSFVVSAEDTYDVPGILKDYGITLTDKIATAPKQDGVIDTDEYNYHSTITIEETLSPGEDSSNKNAAGDTNRFNIIRVALGSLYEGTIEEHFAYDDEWVYYAMDITNMAAQADQTLQQFNFMFDGINGEVTKDVANEILAQCDTDTSVTQTTPFQASGWYGYHYNGTTDHSDDYSRTVGTTLPHVKAAAGIGNGAFKSNVDSDKAALAKLIGDGIGVSADEKVYEIKLSRAYIGNHSSAYCFQTQLRLANNNIIFGAAIDDAAVAAIEAAGLTVPTYGDPALNIAPRFIVIDENKVDVNSMTLPELLAYNGTEHMVLSEPIATPPVPNDKTIGATEYNYHRSFTMTDARTSGDLYVDGAGTAGSIVNTRYDEYFAYDEDYIYYAVTCTRTDTGATGILANSSNPWAGIDFAAYDSSKAHSAYLGTAGSESAYTIGDYFYTTTNAVGRMKLNTQSVVDKLKAETGQDVALGTEYTRDNTAIFNPIAGDVENGIHGNGSTISAIEMKISRRFYADTNIYAYLFAFRGKAYIVGDALSDADKAVLGDTYSVAPRFIIIAEPEGPDYTGMNLPEILAANGAEHVVLDKPIAKAPVQDGTIGAGEYTTTRRFQSVAGDRYYGSLSNIYYFEEYFAYDAEYIYYAVEARNADDTGYRILCNTTNHGAGINFAAYDPNKSNSAYLAAADVGSDYSFGGDSYYVTYASTSPSNGHSYDYVNFGASGAAEKVEELAFGGGVDIATGTPYDHDSRRFKAITEICAWSSTSNENVSVIEIKIARKFYGDTNVYAYLFKARMMTSTGDVPAASSAAWFADGLSDADKAVLGTDYAYAPRFIIVNDPDVATSRAASARLSEDKNLAGLRFKTNVNVKGLEAAGYTINEIGTLIAPTDTIGAGKALAELSLEAGSGAVVGENILKVVADKDTPFATGDKYNTYAGSIVGIKEGNLDRAFSAVGYVNVTKDGETFYIYSDVVASRDVKTIANAAGSDTLTLDEGKESTIYKHYDEEVEAWRPYTSAELKILGYLVTGTYED